MNLVGETKYSVTVYFINSPLKHFYASSVEIITDVPSGLLVIDHAASKTRLVYVIVGHISSYQIIELKPKEETK